MSSSQLEPVDGGNGNRWLYRPFNRQIVLQDETGQEWAISVRPDGQLQTARYPDGEPLTMRMRFNRTALENVGIADDSGLEVDLADNT